MSEKSPAFQVYPGDYLSSERVAMMSLEEEGAYWRALLFSWRNNGIPKDPQRLANLLGKGCSPELAQKISGMFEPSATDPERLLNDRQEQERIKQARWKLRSDQANAERWHGDKPAAKSKTARAPVDKPVEPPKDPITKINSNFSGIIEKLRGSLNRLFERADGETWSYAEDYGLAGICKRPNVIDELALIRKYREGVLPADLRFMFPTTLVKLLDDWTGTLDKARANGTKAPKKSDPNIFVYGAVKFTREKPPTREQFADDSSFTACLEMYNKWLMARPAEAPVAA